MSVIREAIRAIRLAKADVEGDPLKAALDKVERKLRLIYYGFESLDKLADKVNEAFKWLRTLVEAKGRKEDIKTAMGRFAMAWHEYAMKAPLPVGTFPFPPRNRLVDEINDDINELFDMLNEMLKRTEETTPPALRKQFVDEREEERQWIRNRALDKIRSAKNYLKWLNEGLLEDIISNKLRDMVSGVETDLSDLRGNIKRADEFLGHLELHMEREKPDVEMVEALCAKLQELLGPLQNRLRSVLEEAGRQVEEVRKRTNLPSLGKEGLSSIETILHVLEEVVDKMPDYARELRKLMRKPRAPKVKPRFGWLP